ncbi:hypothetical protein MUP29_11760, partial [bacterium]|nr:hypothetical protein [bacterium]
LSSARYLARFEPMTPAPQMINLFDMKAPFKILRDHTLTGPTERNAVDMPVYAASRRTLVRNAG